MFKEFARTNWDSWTLFQNGQAAHMIHLFYESVHMFESGAVPEGWLFGNSEYPWRPNLTRGKIQKILHQSKKYSETKFMVFSNLDLDALL